MKLTITYLHLKSPWQFFALSLNAMRIIRQMRSSRHLGMRKRGFWMKHYTMSLWKNEEDLKKFAASGAHLEAMKVSRSIAREIITLTIDADAFPDWGSAKKMLQEKGKALRF